MLNELKLKKLTISNFQAVYYFDEKSNNNYNYWKTKTK